MTGQAGARCAPSGAITLLASAISYALAACVQVAPGEMTLPTPCADWDLEALLAHLAASMADLESALRTGHLDLEPDDPSTPHPDDPAISALDGDDPVELLRDRAANLLFACYAHHGPDRFVMVGGLPLPAGIVSCTGAVEIAVHGWDIRAARGRGGSIPPALATRMLRLSPLLVTGREGLFGTPVQVPAQASPGDQLIAYLGRHPEPPG
jgi:uncharacterized protein (TIGR03086 family)